MKRVSVTVAAFLMAALTFPAAADEVTYRKHVRPLFQKQCASCHDADAPYLGEFKEKKEEYVANDIGPRMDTYADLIFFIGWPDTGAIMRRLDDGKSAKDGKPAWSFIAGGSVDSAPTLHAGLLCEIYEKYAAMTVTALTSADNGRRY